MTACSDRDPICRALIDAVMAGAAEVLVVKQSGDLGARFKDATELVTAADERSDAAILAVFRERLAAIDPGISFQLEESGIAGTGDDKRAGADPLDGTSHFAAGGNLYSVQAHYVEQGVPLVGVVFQPEAYLPLDESEHCIGRIAWAIRGRGAWVRRTEFEHVAFRCSDARPLRKRPAMEPRALLACVPLSTKMTAEERARAIRIYASGITSVSTGTGCAGGNVMMTIFGGQHVYANFGAGEDLDLIPPQVIAEEAGMTVWGALRRPPVWRVRKQPFVVAPSPEIAERFFAAAGL
jgi:3'-phosphoadenosine 5'-phosphosulfate (PAPS) 3'-phosphatase